MLGVMDIKLFQQSKDTKKLEAPEQQPKPPWCVNMTYIVKTF